MVLDEAYFIERVKNGETDAFKYLIDKYKNIVFNIVLKITRNQEDAEEIAQDVFIKAFNSIKKFKGNSKFSTWLYRIAYNTAISKARKKKIITTNIDDYELSENKVEEIYVGLEKNNNFEKERLIKDAINNLSSDESLIINLYYLEENSVSEISKITSLSVSNVKVKLYRARKKLFKHLSKTNIKELA